MKTIETHPDFWDCECETNYIHLKNNTTCAKCNVYKDDQPDSRIDEITELLLIRLRAEKLKNEMRPLISTCKDGEFDKVLSEYNKANNILYYLTNLELLIT